MQTVLTVTLCVALVLAMVVGVVLEQTTTVFLAIVVPIIIFLSTFWLVTGLGKKNLNLLRKTFGENVVKIAGAIINYFEVPLTIILSACLTLFIFSLSAMFILLPRILGGRF
ncbi:MAG TPA: hypothetical protein PKM88_14895 [bacterium]|nr:hypothetical protein [bacterium]